MVIKRVRWCIVKRSKGRGEEGTLKHQKETAPPGKQSLTAKKTEKIIKKKGVMSNTLKGNLELGGGREGLRVTEIGTVKRTR